MPGRWCEFPQANAFLGLPRMASVGGGPDRILLSMGAMAIEHNLLSSQSDILSTLVCDCSVSWLMSVGQERRKNLIPYIHRAMFFPQEANVLEVN